MGFSMINLLKLFKLKDLTDAKITYGQCIILYISEAILVGKQP